MSKTIKDTSISLLILGVIFLTLGVIILGYFVEQSSFSLILLGYTLAFIGYFIVINKKNKKYLHWKYILFYSIWVRVILVMGFPNLSDDIYRFIWDGQLIINGIHPLSMLPSQIMNSSMDLQGISKELFNQLNSPDYFTIYPPFAQLIFTLSVFVSPSSIFVQMMTMKLLLLVGDLIGIYFLYRILRHLQLPLTNIFIYALNPLVIVEIMGNMHFEGWMISLLFGAVYFLLKRNYLWCALLLGFSIATKLLPLMFVPIILIFINKWRGILIFGITLGACLLLLFIPYFYTLDFINFISSFQLYFQKFEFNASIYYVIRKIGFYFEGYNIIQTLGPILGIAAMMFIMIRSWYFSKNRSDLNLLIGLFFIYLIYLLFAMTIHPWYIIMLVALSCFVKSNSAIIWSYFITLTYINYSYNPYHENLYIVVLEYVILAAVLIRELRLNKFLLKPISHDNISEV